MNNLCIRRVDELGRITLPADVRRWLDIKEKDCLEITVDLKEGKIILSKSSARYETNEAQDMRLAKPDNIIRIYNK